MTNNDIVSSTETIPNVSAEGQKSANVPNLRFIEFDKEWVKIPIKKLLKFQNGINADATKYGKGIKYISVTDILNNKFITYDLIKGLVDIDTNTLKHYIVEYGDILFQRSSETFEDIGRSNVYLDKNIPATFGGFVIRGKKIGEYDPLFFKYHLDSPCSRKKVIRMGAGAQHFNIGQVGLEQIELKFPIIKEQEKISTFLLLIDERISTQSKIIKEIETFKKAICNKIFGNPNWEKYRVGDIGTLGRGRVISTSEINSSVNPKYPVYSSQTSNNGVMGYIDTYEFDGEYITWTTDGANAGTVFYRNGKFNCTNVCGTIKLNNMVDAYFVTYALQQAAKKYVSTNLANPKLMNNVMADICIYCPDLTTQKRISSLVRLLDEKIAIEEQILNGYKESKHYLLSNLFI